MGKMGRRARNKELYSKIDLYERIIKQRTIYGIAITLCCIAEAILLCVVCGHIA